MGSGQQGFDIQNFFKSSSPSPTPPAPYNMPSNHPNQPYPFSPQNPYSSSPFPTQSPSAMYSYMHYPQESHVRPSYPSSSFIQTPFSQPAVTPLPQSSVPQASVSSPPLDGARLMALLNTQSTADLRESSSPLLSHPSSLELPPAVVSTSVALSTVEPSEPPPAISPALPSAPPVSLAPQAANLRKNPKGRYFTFKERLVYDIDKRLPGEEQPQLEVTTITVYNTEPVLVVGRQIAVNKNYICYGLRAGTIRILNIHTAARNLFRGHTQRVIDMAFQSNEVHVLASSSTEGRVFVRRIVESPGEDNKGQISEQILVAVQFAGEWESAQPRVCWHPRQDMLVVGIGKYVLIININKFKMGVLSSDDPVKFNVKSTTNIDGIRVLGTHEDEVTGLAACPGTVRFASCSKDGTVRVWNDTHQMEVLAPHAMLPVNSIAFLSAPRRQDSVVLLTAGPLNRELKLWTPVGKDALTWKCIQTLELKSSQEKKLEDAFFNQMATVPQASAVVLANAKKDAIYVVHLDFGQSSSSPRMDYLAEFSVRMPILSFTVTADNVIDGEGNIQVYCVQTQAIQQYTLDLAMCLSSGQEGKVESDFTGTVTTDYTPVTVTPSASSPSVTPVEKPGFMESTEKAKVYGETLYDTKEKEQYKQEKSSPDSEQIDKAVLSDGIEASTDGIKSGELKTEINEKSDKESSKQTQPHLITPSELMSMVARSKNEVPSKSEDETKDVEAGTSESKVISESFDDRRSLMDSTEDSISDALEGANVELSAEGEYSVISEPGQQVDEVEGGESSGLPIEDIAELKEVSSRAGDSSAYSVSQTPAVTKGKNKKNKANPDVVVPSASTPSPPEADGTGVPAEGLAAQVLTMQNTLNQLVNMQKDLQKQLPVIVTVPMAKEGKRMETSLGQRLEKILKANTDAMYAKLLEENAKREKVDRERSQQLVATFTGLINNVAKDVPANMEKVLKKELATVGPAVAKFLSPAIEKAVTTGLADSSQSVNEKTLSQLEKTVCAKLEASVGRQLHSQFQTTGRQALQDAMKACFEVSVVPSFERSCRAMFEQVDAAFQKGMAEHITNAQQQVSVSQGALASSIQESVNSFAQTLKSELADNQRKVAAIAESRYASFNVKAPSGALPDKVLSLQHVEETLDPTIEITRLLSQGKLEDAFTKALSRSDVAIVSWLCNQVDPNTVFSTSPLPLSQGVLLSLVQQLGCDLGKDTARKLTWIQGASLALNPSDPVLAPHMRPFLDQLYQNLHRQMMVTTQNDLQNSLRLVVHVVNSLLTSCK